MELSSVTKAWRGVDTGPCSDDLLQEAYQEGVDLFISKLTRDKRKREWIDTKHDISDVAELIFQAKKEYGKKSDSKAYEWISKFSSRMQYYSPIMDTMSQHHPEYVSLVWGAIKFCFIGVLNHGELITQLSKALVQIGEALPRAAIKFSLYPTETMKHAVAMIYSQVIKFLIRALGWYNEGKLKHAYHAITQPFSLRYKDIVDEIQNCSRRIEQLAADAAQAEQRDMHITLHELKKLIIEHQALTSAGLLDTNRRLCELQFSEILTFVTTTPLLRSPESNFNHQLAMRNRRRRGTSTLNLPQSYNQLQTWASSDHSSLVITRGSFAARTLSRDLAVSIIETIKESGIPVVWALNSKNYEPDSEPNFEMPSALDVLKHLVLQVLRINQTILNERSVSLNAARYKSATTEQEWFDLLGSAIAGLPQLYIIIDVEVMGLDCEDKSIWPRRFIELFEALMVRNLSSKVKVVLISYGTRLSVEPSPFDGGIMQLRNKTRRQNSSRVTKSTRSARGRGRKGFLTMGKP